MTKVINISDEAYEELLKRSSKKQIEISRSVSMAEILDEILDFNTIE